MAKVTSKIDAEATYEITSRAITVSRGGDSMQISYENLESTIVIFKADIKAEILELCKQRIRTCPICNEQFIPKGRQKYCGQVCGRKANIQGCKARYKKNNPKADNQPKKESQLNDLIREAKALGLSYGQLQAMKYKEQMRFN